MIAPWLDRWLPPKPAATIDEDIDRLVGRWIDKGATRLDILARLEVKADMLRRMPPSQGA